MPNALAFSVENNFVKGLITEASGLNFPENACTETYNCEFNLDGSVSRRPGFDFEVASTTKTIDRNNAVVNVYLWKNVSGNGDLTLVVMQVGATIYFYKTNGSSISGGAVSTTVSLTSVSGAPSAATVEAQFAAGNGLLFITHPYCEPMYVSYNSSTDTATATNITLKVRDLEGAVADVLAVDARPTSTLAGLSAEHAYNLYNQGWTTTNLTTWDTNRTDMPSNADVMWRFKNSSNAFDTSVVANVVAGNTPAPKGHFILTLSNQDRDTAAGTSGVAATTTSYYRPSTCAFFAGRIFYSGITYTGFNANIYFSQIIENSKQYGNCYQLNDPTAEDLFDLLPSDGGVIRIHEAGTIYKLFTVPGGLAVFSANGVWLITGSTGLGFTANDYTVQKIANIPVLSANSFVNVGGYPSWWNADGIYIMGAEGGASSPAISTLTWGSIKSFYDTIPITSKRYARGFYHPINGKIHWIFKSSDTDQLTETFEFDRILTFNTQTKAFYPWQVSESDVKINAVFVTDFSTGDVSINNVIDDSSNNVIDGSGNQVISFSSLSSVTSPNFKYLVSYPDSGSYKFTFADESNTDYIDWFQYDTVGVDYTSYFVTGYKLRGQGIKKFNSNWVSILSGSEDETQYFFQGIWDYATTGSGTGRWSVRQLVSHPADDFNYKFRRLKVRGRGKSLQFRVQSVSGKPFEIAGWTSMDLGNSLP